MSEGNSDKSFKLNDYSNECLEIKNPHALKALGISVKGAISKNTDIDQLSYENFEIKQDSVLCVPPWAKTWRKAVGYSKLQHEVMEAEKLAEDKEVSTGKRKVAFIGAHEDVFIFGLKPVQGKKDLFYFRHPDTKSKQVFHKDSAIIDENNVITYDNINQCELDISEKSDKQILKQDEMTLEKTIEKNNIQEQLGMKISDHSDAIIKATEEFLVISSLQESKGDEGSEKLSEHLEIELETSEHLDLGENNVKAEKDEQNEVFIKENGDSDESHMLKDLVKTKPEEEEEADKEIHITETVKEQKEEVEKTEELMIIETDEEGKGTVEVVEEDGGRRGEESEEETGETTEKERKGTVRSEERAPSEKEDVTSRKSSIQTTKERIDNNKSLNEISNKSFLEALEKKKSSESEKVFENEQVTSTLTEKSESLLEKSKTESFIKAQQLESPTTSLTHSVEEKNEEDKSVTDLILGDSFHQKTYISSETDMKRISSVSGKMKPSITLAESVSLGATKQTKQDDIHHIPTPNEAYLREHLGKTLVTALSEVAYKRPADPIHYLSQFLYKQCCNLQARQTYDDEKENLMLLREHNHYKQQARKKLNIVKLQNTVSRLSKVSTQLLLNETEGNFETPTTINEDGGLKQEALDRSELKIESTIENSE